MSLLGEKKSSYYFIIVVSIYLLIYSSSSTKFILVSKRCSIVPRSILLLLLFLRRASFYNSSSSSISLGFNNPPTFMARCLSFSFASWAAFSRSSANKSALSAPEPPNSFSWIKKSLNVSLNRTRSST